MARSLHLDFREPVCIILAGLGYPVHLVDIVPRHIEQTRQAAQQGGSPQLASMRVGDAVALASNNAVIRIAKTTMGVQRANGIVHP